MIQAHELEPRMTHANLPTTEPVDDAEIRRVNVGSSERNISIAVGAVLGAAGLARPFSLRGLACLGAAVALIHRGLTGHCKLYNAMDLSTVDHGDNDPGSARPEEYFRKSIHVAHAVTILKPASDLYRFWKQLENLPRFMDHLKDVKKIDDKRSHWIAKGPMNISIEWDAEIINDEPDRLIAWRSVGDAEVDNSGTVRFVPASGDGRTEVQVTLDYIPPAGRLGAMVAKLFGEDPERQIKEDLRRFKQIMEAGEITPNADDQPRQTYGSE